jgi:hypothetical protein
MKTTIFVLLFLSAAAAFGQGSAGGAALSSEPMVLQFRSHAKRATSQGMGSGQDLLEKSKLLYARGERPVWEFLLEKQEIPLGDVARMFREEHATAKKATHVLEK